VNRKTQVRAWWELHRAAARRVRGIDGLVDGGGIKRLAVANGAKGFDVERRSVNRYRGEPTGQEETKVNYEYAFHDGSTPACFLTRRLALVQPF
jgi:hypothetical protein